MNKTKTKRTKVRRIQRDHDSIKYRLTESDIRRIIREELTAWRLKNP